jgi:hypothetical protein
MRVKRGTLPSTREGGRLYVLLDPEPTTEPTTEPERPHDRTNELIATLREQLQAERAAHGESRRLLAAALERIPPQIEAPSDERESPTAATPQPGRVEPQPAVESMRAQESNEMAMPSAGGGPQPRDQRGQTPAEPRSWWRRMFGG